MEPKDPRRNKPTEKERDNDPNLRDATAIQPGISTVSNSDYDNENEKLTKTGADDFREEDNSDDHSDISFDEEDYD